MIDLVSGNSSFRPVSFEICLASMGVTTTTTFRFLPVGENDDGTIRRLINVRGRNNPNLVSGDESPVTGNIVTTGVRPVRPAPEKGWHPRAEPSAPRSRARVLFP